MPNCCSMCGGSTTVPNYQKQVDPLTQRYGTILGDAPPTSRRSCGHMGGSMAGPVQLCLPMLASPPCPPSPGHHNPGQQPTVVNVPCEAACPPGPCPPISGRHNPGQQPCVVNVPCDIPKPCPKFVCEPCPPPPPTKVWLIKSSPMPQKSFAIAQPPPCIPICNQPICIPCQRPC